MRQGVLTFRWILYGCLITLLANACSMIRQTVVRPTANTPFLSDLRASSLNLRQIDDLQAQSYRFMVVGHLYGTPDGDDIDPDGALIQQVPALKKMDLSMMVSLGDMVRHSTKTDFNRLKEMLLDPLPYPIFNTVGNHDVQNRALYQARFGITYYTFRYGPVDMIFLDTVKELCSVDSEQMAMLRRALPQAVNDPQVRHIFIFMHHTLFFQNEVLFELKNRAAGPNSWECYGQGNFAQVMKELVAPAAAQKPVYLFAGDVGAWGNLSPYIERRTNPSLTMVMTGLGDLPTDSTILVTVNGESVQLEVYKLVDGSLHSIEEYTPAYWEKIGRGK